MSSQIARGGRFVLLGIVLSGLGLVWLRIASVPLEMRIATPSETFSSRPFLVWGADDFYVADLQIESAENGFPALGSYSWTLRKFGRVIASSNGPVRIAAEASESSSPVKVGGVRLFLEPGVYRLDGHIDLRPGTLERYRPRLVVSDAYPWPQAVFLWIFAVVLVEIYGLTLIIEAYVRRLSVGYSRAGVK